jgi:hypothetical protein
MTCRNLQCIVAAAALLSASGCVGVEADFSQADSDEIAIAEVEPTRIALRAGTASAGADEIDGYCESGVGVYLSATADRAELTLYVVAPAESATFEHPALRLTTQEGDGQKTDISEFETVTLVAGESRVFAKHAEGTLMNVVAEVAAE